MVDDKCIMSYTSITSCSGSGSMSTPDAMYPHYNCRHNGGTLPFEIAADVTWIKCMCGQTDAFIHSINRYLPFANQENIQNVLMGYWECMYGGNKQFDNQLQQQQLALPPASYTYAYDYQLPVDNYQGFYNANVSPSGQMFLEETPNNVNENNIRTVGRRNRGSRQDSWNDRTSKHCVFCRKNGEPQMLYKTHVLRMDGKVTCPILRKYVCPVCKKSGDEAHTLKHCPENQGESAITGRHEISRSGRNARGILGKTYRYE